MKNSPTSEKDPNSSGQSWKFNTQKIESQEKWSRKSYVNMGLWRRVYRVLEKFVGKYMKFSPVHWTPYELLFQISIHAQAEGN